MGVSLPGVEREGNSFQPRLLAARWPETRRSREPGKPVFREPCPGTGKPALQHGSSSDCTPLGNAPATPGLTRSKTGWQRHTPALWATFLSATQHCPALSPWKSSQTLLPRSPGIKKDFISYQRKNLKSQSKPCSKKAGNKIVRRQ